MSRPRRRGLSRLFWLCALAGAAYLAWRWRQRQADELSAPYAPGTAHSTPPAFGTTHPASPSLTQRGIPNRVHRSAPAAPEPAESPAPAAEADAVPVDSPAPDTEAPAAPAESPAPDEAPVSRNLTMPAPAAETSADAAPETMPPAPDGVPETSAPADEASAVTYTPDLAPAGGAGAPEVLSSGSPNTVSEDRAPAPPDPSLAASGVGLVNINTADEDALVALPGIGRALARRIIAYRTQHGPFSSVDQLIDVQGIGPRNIDDFRAFITV